MFSIREINYDTHQSSEALFSRLTWTVEKVDGIGWELFRKYSPDTTKPWIGVYDKEKNTFGLLEPRGVFTMMPFRVVVRGKITSRDDKTFVNIKFRLSIGTLLYCLMFYLMTAFLVAGAISSLEINFIVPVLVWILVFPGFGTLLLNRKLNQIEKRIEGLLSLV
jgi:hypothetical protein